MYDFYVHFIIAISFCVSVFLWKATGKTFAFSDNLRIDSLEHMAMDSIYRNPRYAHSALDEALSLTKDSDKYYKLLAAKSQTYLQIVYMIPGLFYIGQL